MAKRWSVTSLVVLALLAYFAGTEVVAAPQYGGTKTQSQNPGMPQGSQSGSYVPNRSSGAGSGAATYGMYSMTGTGTYGGSGSSGSSGSSGTGGSYGGSGTYGGSGSSGSSGGSGTYGGSGSSGGSGTSSNPWMTSTSQNPKNPPPPQNPQSSNTGGVFYGIYMDESQTASKQKPKPQDPKNPPQRQSPRPPPPPQNPPKNPPKPPKTQQLSSDQNVRNPTVPQTQQSWNPTEPSNPAETCNVDRMTRVACGPRGVSAAECEALDCCHDGQNCYYRNAVTVQCTKDGQFILVVAKDATLPSLDTDTINLMGSGTDCMCVDSNSAFAIYQFPVTSCGSVVKEESGVIIYENRMVSSFTVDQGPVGVITRDSHFEVFFQCRYIGTSVQALVVDVLKLDNPPLPVSGMGSLNVAMRIGNGQCNTKGCDEVSAAYSSFYTEGDYPVAKILREPVYVDIHIVDKKDPAYVLTLDHCWATSTPNPHSMPQWDLLVDGCSYRDDNYMTRMVPVPSDMDFASHHKRFFFQMFTFVEQSSKNTQQQNLYIHCTTAVCVPGPNTRCEPLCMRKKRDVSGVEQVAVEPKTVVSSGQLIMSAPQE